MAIFSVLQFDENKVMFRRPVCKSEGGRLRDSFWALLLTHSLFVEELWSCNLNPTALTTAVWCVRITEKREYHILNGNFLQILSHLGTYAVQLTQLTLWVSALVILNV